MSQLSIAAKTEQIKTLVFDYLTKGFSAGQIQLALQAENVFLSTRTLKGYISSVQHEMRQARQKSMVQHFDSELAVIQRIRAEAMQAYTTSDTPIVHEKIKSETQRSVVPGDNMDASGNAIDTLINGAGAQNTTKIISERTIVGQDKDAKFLQIALNASDQISKMLKLDIDKVNAEEEVKNGIEQYTDSELSEMDAATIARLIDEQIQATPNS